MTARGRPPCPTGPTCVRLFDAGRSAGAIAAALRLDPSTVRGHLRRAGRSPAAARLIASRAAAERSRAAWEAAADLVAASAAVGMTKGRAATRAAELRARGVPLKRMGYPPGRVRRAIERLWRRGSRPAAIARRLDVPPAYVYVVVRRLRVAAALGRRPGP
jgi:DNA-binding CsgD family transcriptional regulator